MENHIEYLYVLDYNTDSICKIVLTDEDSYNINIDEILESYGLDFDYCSYMFSEKNNTNIKELKKKDY